MPRTEGDAVSRTLAVRIVVTPLDPSLTRQEHPQHSTQMIKSKMKEEKKKNGLSCYVAHGSSLWFVYLQLHRVHLLNMRLEHVLALNTAENQHSAHFHCMRPRPLCAPQPASSLTFECTRACCTKHPRCVVEKAHCAPKCAFEWILTRSTAAS